MKNAKQEFEELLSGVLDGTPDSSRNDRLNELLRHNPALQNNYLDLLQLHALLIWREGRVVPAEKVNPADRKIEIGNTCELDNSPTPSNWPIEESVSRRSRWAAVAALVCVAAGLGFVFTFFSIPFREAEAGPEVVERLIGWNLDIAEAATGDERMKIFNTGSVSMKGLLTISNISPEDRDLSQSLVDNGAWLANNDDPVTEAERFGDIADKLLVRIDTATGKKDNKKIIKYAESYSKLTELGVAKNLERAIAAKVPHDPKHRHKIEHLIAGDANRAKQLDDMLERQTDSSWKAVNRARKAHPRKYNYVSKP